MQLVDWPLHQVVGGIQTTRLGGCSRPPYSSFNLGFHVGDDEDTVLANHRVLSEFLPNPPFWLDQVHSANVLEVTNSVTEQKVFDRPKADALYTKLKAQPLAIMTADCLPILLASNNGKEVAAVHGGWRPLAGNIIEKTVEKFTAPNQQISAWLGPAIGPTAFEVGPDVVNAFRCMDPSHINDFIELQNQKFLADIFSITKRQLSSLGITRIYSQYECTFSTPTKYFSYRRDVITGRLATLIWRK
ncbi:peptidoglycan editing factor PgeF [Pseudoalteromonas phenolica]|uniref:Purine nucleoside phosphorylase n=1 Tax=Pseudoalteromonas phenolica TaxID=161398 RepID=A0A5R9PXX5_9GAMM|nr:peptidoglycan editing factor PgeF [Pseudoalteromonas phenolica]TLX45768.1 peptidoglycan editing factor PgeF [Pseudoalteromonas phenolica]